MTDATSGDFIAPIPHQIESDWHDKWGPLLAGFPLNIMYSSVEPVVTAAIYDPDLATFNENDTAREMTYRNQQGGIYCVRVVMQKASGVLKTSKYRGEELIASASGHDFDSAMAQTTMIGIQKDEPVTVL